VNNTDRQDMRRISIFALIVLLAGGCATASSDGVSASEKRDLGKLVSPRFEFTKNRESDVYGILKAVKATQPNWKVDSITFDPMQGVTIFFSASENGFSVHGGPFAKVTRDGDVWKIGELWTLQ
jgi:hypothetical protein